MEDNKPNYYAVIPAEIRYDQNLKANEKLMYGEIAALSNKTGECWANNNYFAELYGVSNKTVSTWIHSLIACGYIETELEYKGKEISGRKIKLLYPYGKKLPYLWKKTSIPMEEKVIDNNISINNISNNKEKDNIIINNNIIQKESKNKFKIPTLEEVQKYITEKKLNINAKQFIDYYEEGNWCDSKGNKVKNWKQKLLTWNGRRQRNSASNRPTTYIPDNTEKDIWLGTEEEFYKLMEKQKGDK